MVNLRTIIKVTLHPVCMGVTLSLLLICSSCKNQQSNAVKIYAAAGFRIPAEILCNRFEKEKNITIQRNYASSGTLARQISAGAEADIYISANKKWMEYLNSENMLLDSILTPLASNQLVVITSIDKPDFSIQYDSLFDITSTIQNKIAIGDPAHVPVGLYSKTILDSLGWFSPLIPNMVLAKDVSSVLHLVALKECDWGIVYYTEAIQSKKVKIVSTIPASLHPPIHFYIATLKNSNPHSSDLFDCFKNKKSAHILAGKGFGPILMNNSNFQNETYPLALNTQKLNTNNL
ncbi:molybdate ABC transporter substrate-binding protein [Labilibacter sediminis]|nr:molybdate ABC transporter substrate-binding protein [Labilibacter sediminis]